MLSLLTYSIEMYKSSERAVNKAHNEAASPASVPIDHNGKDPGSVYNNIPGNSPNKRGGRGVSSRNQQNRQLTTDIFGVNRNAGGKDGQPLSNSPAQRGSLVKLNPLMGTNNGGNQVQTNFTGINIRRQAPTQSMKPSKKEKAGQLGLSGAAPT